MPFDLQTLQMYHKVCQMHVTMCVQGCENVLSDSDYEFRGPNLSRVNDSLEGRK